MTDSPPRPRTASEDLLGFVTEAGRRLGSALDYESAVAAVTRTAVPRLAELAILILGPADAAARIEAVHEDPDATVRVRGIVAAQADALRRLGRRIAAGRRTEWLRETTPWFTRRFAAGDPAIPVLLDVLDLGSVIALPLEARGRVLAVVILGRSRGKGPFTGAELAAAQALGRRGAAALDGVELQRMVLERAAQLRQSEEAERRWAHAFENAGSGAAILGVPDLRIESANPALVRMHGAESGSPMAGRTLTELLAPAQDEARAMLSAISPGQATYEAMHRRDDGSLFPVLVSITPVRLAESGAPYRAVSVQDLSDVKRAEERLHRAQRMEAVGRLAGGVAHEVNNMMTIILGFTEFVIRDKAVAAHRDDLDEIRKAAQRAAAVTQQLLAFSRQQILEPEILELDAVVTDMARGLAPLLPANISVAADPRGGGRVVADRSQLDQVIINLVFNARDAMPEGGSITLETSARTISAGEGPHRIGVEVPPGNYAAIRVTDTGSGMSPDTLARAFEPFFTTKGLGQGTGLGLATVYGIVKQSNGYVWAESELGRGTTFTICLPTVSAAPTAEPENEAVEAHGWETVLVVEDEPSVRDLAARVLEQAGYRTIRTSNADEALAVVHADPRRVHLVLTDVVMPGLSGRALRERLHAVAPELPVVFMSGYAGDEVLDRGLVSAGDPFIEKPFTPQALAERVRAVLDAHPAPA